MTMIDDTQDERLVLRAHLAREIRRYIEDVQEGSAKGTRFGLTTEVLSDDELRVTLSFSCVVPRDGEQAGHEVASFDDYAVLDWLIHLHTAQVGLEGVRKALGEDFDRLFVLEAEAGSLG